MRSSLNRRGRCGNMGRSTNIVTFATLRSALRYQKRWQPRQRRVESTSHSKLGSSYLSQSDQDALLRQQALSMAQQGHHAKAIDLFSELIDRNPHSAHDYNNRGLVYFQSGQMEEAIADYNKALDINPCLDSVYNNRANYYASQGQLLAAILDYDIAIDLNPSNVRAWINQGITFRDLRMYEQSVSCFDLALCFGRLEGHVYAERGRAYHLWGDWNCAVADYQKAIATLSNSQDLNLKRSQRLLRQVENWLNLLLEPLF